MKEQSTLKQEDHDQKRPLSRKKEGYWASGENYSVSPVQKGLGGVLEKGSFFRLPRIRRQCHLKGRKHFDREKKRKNAPDEEGGPHTTKGG